ncbi:MAG: hypothetical protein M3392_04200, partial [Actinomycetota bacterium]|nr:hypothetical protein [Actinomycetota bacterium]
LYFVAGRVEGADGASLGGVRRSFVPIMYALLTAIAVISSLITIKLAAQVSSLDMDGRGPKPGDFDYQQKAATQVRERFGEDAKIASIGVPQLLVLLSERNPNAYAFIIRGIDHEIALRTPGGFEGWLQELGAYDPDVIAFGKTSGKYKPELMDWLRSHYVREQIGPWIVFVKEEHAVQARVLLEQRLRRAGNV